jgi:PKD repeat protein
MAEVGAYRTLRTIARAAGLCLATALALALPGSARAVAPSASFSYTPTIPQTLETVTFTSTSTGDISSYAWDLDNDSFFDDGTSSTVSRSFPIPGIYAIGLQVMGSGGKGEQTQFVTVTNRAPVASFTFFPSNPVAGSVINFVSTARDPDGTIANQVWDLDNDGSFDDGSGGFASTTFAAPGSYPVRLQVTDNNRAIGNITQTVEVASKPLALASPFPVVRLVGKPTRNGVRITRFTVEAPSGARVAIRCRGGGCPRHGQVRRARQGNLTATVARLLRFRRFERRLGAGAAIRIFVTKPGTVGKYTSFRVRKGKAPKRRDLCMLPDARLPSPCPGA